MKELRDEGMKGWRDEGMKGWRDEGMKGWRDKSLHFQVYKKNPVERSCYRFRIPYWKGDKYPFEGGRSLRARGWKTKSMMPL